MGKIEIHAITKIINLSATQAHNLIVALDVDVSNQEKLLTLEQCKETLYHCPHLVAKSIDHKVDVTDFLFCFDSKQHYVCCQDKLSFSTHKIVLLPKSGLTTSAFNQLSFVDKVRVATQTSMADCNGMLQLPWGYLCKEQLISAAAAFSILLTSTQIQNCSNLASLF